LVYLLISQRAKANNRYNLKNLTGHGRFDVVVRCILAATRQLTSDPGEVIYAYLKGSEPWGWLEIQPQFVKEDDDEISLAAKIQERWDDIFTEGILSELVNLLEEPFLLLSENGEVIESFSGTIVLGAQNDLVDADLDLIPITQKISLGKRSLLASHAIIYSRQLNIKR